MRNRDLKAFFFQLLDIPCSVIDLELWRAAFCSRVPPAASVDDSLQSRSVGADDAEGLEVLANGHHNDAPVAGSLSKTRSCENLSTSDGGQSQNSDAKDGSFPTSAAQSTRRLSDPSVPAVLETSAQFAAGAPLVATASDTAVQTGNVSTKLTAPASGSAQASIDVSPSNDVTASYDVDDDAVNLGSDSNAVMDGAMTSSLSKLDTQRNTTTPQNTEHAEIEVQRPKSCEPEFPRSPSAPTLECGVQKSNDPAAVLPTDTDASQPQSKDNTAAVAAAEHCATVQPLVATAASRDVERLPPDDVTNEEPSSTATTLEEATSGKETRDVKECDESSNHGSNQLNSKALSCAAAIVSQAPATSAAIGAAVSETFGGSKSKPIALNRRPHSLADAKQTHSDATTQAYEDARSSQKSSPMTSTTPFQSMTELGRQSHMSTSTTGLNDHPLTSKHTTPSSHSSSQNGHSILKLDCATDARYSIPNGKSSSGLQRMSSVMSNGTPSPTAEQVR